MQELFHKLYDRFYHFYGRSSSQNNTGAWIPTAVQSVFHHYNLSRNEGWEWTDAGESIIYAIRHQVESGHYLSNVMVWDIDAKSLEQLPDATASKDGIVTYLKELGISPWVFRSSPNGGYHVVVFLDKPSQSSWLNEKAQYIKNKCKVGNTHIDVFPSGNPIRLALVPKKNGDKGYIIEEGSWSDETACLLKFSTRKFIPNNSKNTGTSSVQITESGTRHHKMLELVRQCMNKGYSKDDAFQAATEQYKNAVEVGVVKATLLEHHTEFNRAWDNWEQKFKPLSGQTKTGLWKQFNPKKGLKLKQLVHEAAKFANEHKLTSMPFTQKWVADYYGSSDKWARTRIMELRQTGLLQIADNYFNQDRHYLSYSVERILSVFSYVFNSLFPVSYNSSKEQKQPVDPSVDPRLVLLNPYPTVLQDST